ncbi:MAG: caspase family protein [Bacteroidales bacterium]
MNTNQKVTIRAGIILFLSLLCGLLPVMGIGISPVTELEPATESDPPVISWHSPSAERVLSNTDKYWLKACIRSSSRLAYVKIQQNDVGLPVTLGSATPSSDSCALLLNFDIKLIPGENKVFIMAGNEAGNTSSEMRYIMYFPPGIPTIGWTNPSGQKISVGTPSYPIRADIYSISELQATHILVNEMELIGDAGVKSISRETGFYQLEKEIPLAAGENTIYFTTGNVYGRVTSKKKVIIYQPQTPPVIVWNSPENQRSDSHSELTEIEAAIKSALPLQEVQLILNGKLLDEPGNAKTAVYRAGEFIFSKKVKLNRGDNEIVIKAVNAIGEQLSDSRFINFQPLNPPEITWVSPGTGSVLSISDVYWLRACLKSKSKIQNVKAFLNNDVTNVTMGLNEAGSDSCPVLLNYAVKLTPGENRVYLTASNSGGSDTSEVRTIDYLPASVPIIKWENPVEARQTVKTSTYTLRADIISLSQLQNTKIYINDIELLGEAGVVLENKASGKYRLEREIPLQQGENNISITSLNSYGKMTSRKRVLVYVVPQSPLISWNTPADPWTEQVKNNLQYSITINSSEPVESVQVFLNGNPISSVPQVKPVDGAAGTFALLGNLSLQKGENVVYVSARNPTGTRESEKRKIVVRPLAAPVITWINPGENRIVSNSEGYWIRACLKSGGPFQYVKIQLNDVGQTVLQSPNDLNSDSCSWLLNFEVKLNQGENKVFIMAGNAAGNSSSDMRSIIYLPTSIPVITWTNPQEPRITTNAGTYQLTAEIFSSTALEPTHIFINDIELIGENTVTATSVGSYTFTREVPLQQGENSIYISAANAKGKADSKKKILVYEQIVAPVISWSSPPIARSSVTNKTAYIIASIKSDQPVLSAKVEVNGQTMSSSPDIRPGKIKGEYILQSILPLNAGENEIVISATNSAGHGTSEKRVLVLQTDVKPEILSVTPVEPKTSVTGETARVSAVIRSASMLGEIDIFLNGKLLPQVGNANIQNKGAGEYQLEESFPLQIGENSFYFIVKNAAGSDTSDMRFITRISEQQAGIDNRSMQNKAIRTETREAPVEVVREKIALPVVTWVNPDKQVFETNLSAVLVRATVKSAEKPASIFVYVNNLAPEDASWALVAGTKDEYRFEKKINLQPGTNKVYLEVSNSAGTIRSDLRTLNSPVDKPPVIQWGIPSEPNSIVNQENFTIEACVNTLSDLKSISVLVNGTEQGNDLVLKRNEQGDCNYTWQKEIILKEGENSVFILASNESLNNRSEKRIIKYEKAAIEKRIALVIGNSEYIDSKSLKNTVNDANLMEATLKELGFEVIKRLNANQAGMNKAIEEFSKRLPEYNVGLFYYAGHGVQVDGTNYLIPVDATLQEKADCKFQAVKVDFVIEEFQKYPDNINIVILDACRDNPFRSWTRGGAQVFKPIPPTSGTIIAFATVEGSVAADGTGLHGPFTEELVKQMLIPQPVESVFKKTRVLVQKRTNGAQNPMEWSMLKGEFFFKK